MVYTMYDMYDNKILLIMVLYMCNIINYGTIYDMYDIINYGTIYDMFDIINYGTI